MVLVYVFFLSSRERHRENKNSARGAAGVVTMFLLSVSCATSVVKGSALGLGGGSSAAEAKRRARAG